MSLASPSLRQQVVDTFCTQISATPDIRAVYYDEPFNFDIAPLPCVWVYDHDEELSVDTMQPYFVAKLEMAALTVYRYDQSGSYTMRRRGNILLAAILSTMMADHTLGGMAFDCLPIGSTMQDLAEDAPNVGLLSTAWEVQYFVPLTNPYTAAVA